MSSESDYWVGPTIGEGSFGHVVYAVHKPTNRKVAIKVLEVTSDRKPHQQQAARIAMIRNERKLLSLPRVRSCPWIVDLWAAFCGKPSGSSQCLYFVLALASGGDLRGLIQEGLSSKGRALWRESRGWYASQLIRAVDSLHSMGILHCDLKPENVLLDAPTGRLQLADFGCAVELPKQQQHQQQQSQRVPEQRGQPSPWPRLEPQIVVPRGTALYASPEVLRALPPWKLTVGVDYWSVGCILHALWHGSSPFDKGSEALTVRAIFAKEEAGSTGDDDGGGGEEEKEGDPAQQFVRNENENDEGEDDDDDDDDVDDDTPLRRLSRDLVAVLPEDRIRAWKNQAFALASVHSQNDNDNENGNGNRCHGEGTIDPPPGEDKQPCDSACARKTVLLPTPAWQEEVANATLRDGSLGWLVFQL